MLPVGVPTDCIACTSPDGEIRYLDQVGDGRGYPWIDCVSAFPVKIVDEEYGRFPRRFLSFTEMAVRLENADDLFRGRYSMPSSTVHIDDLPLDQIATTDDCFLVPITLRRAAMILRLLGREGDDGTPPGAPPLPVRLTERLRCRSDIISTQETTSIHVTFRRNQADETISIKQNCATEIKNLAVLV